MASPDIKIFSSFREQIIPIPNSLPKARGRTKWGLNRVVMFASLALVLTSTACGVAASPMEQKTPTTVATLVPTATPEPTAISTPNRVIPTPPPFETVDLNQIPQGKEQESKEDLEKLQKILKAYINTSEQELGSKELANNYKTVLDNIITNSSGKILKSSDGFPSGDPNKQWDDVIKYGFDNPSIQLYRRIGSISGLERERYLDIFLDEHGHIANTSGGLNNQLMLSDDVVNFIKIFKCPPGWNWEIISIDDFVDPRGVTTGNDVIIIRRYPDGSTIDITGSTDGHFRMHINSGSQNGLDP